MLKIYNYFFTGFIVIIIAFLVVSIANKISSAPREKYLRSEIILTPSRYCTGTNIQYSNQINFSRGGYLFFREERTIIDLLGNAIIGNDSELLLRGGVLNQTIMPRNYIIYLKKLPVGKYHAVHTLRDENSDIIGFIVDFEIIKC